MVLDDELARGLIDATPDALVVTDEEGRIVFVNAACEAMFGYARAELVSQPIELLVPANRRPAHRAAFAGFARSPVVRPMGTGTTLAGRKKDGGEIPVEVSLGTMRTKAGVHFLAVVRDATARVLAEETLKRSERALLEPLRRSEESLVRAQRAAHVGSFEWDLRTNTVVRSAELCALLGLGPEAANAPPMSLTEVIPPSERDRVLQAIQTARRDTGSYEIEHRLSLRDGTERVVFQRGDVVVEDGHAVRVVGTMLDITERKRLEDEQEATLQQLEAVFERCPVGIVLAQGARGEHLEFNARAKALVGRPMDHVGEYPELLLTPDGRPLAPDERPMQRALNGERFASVDLLMQRADGSRMPVSASGAPIPDVRGGEPRAVLVFEDMTAVKELERLRAEWSSIVAHDLRQPLNVIALQAGTAQRSLRRAPGGLPEEAIQAMDAIRRQVSRLNRMIDDLLDLSALEARRLALSRRPTDLAEVARSSLELVRADGGEAHSIELHVGGPLPVVDVDPDRIAQVLENLLSNAVKYGSPGAPIVVALGTSPGQVHVTVTNEGPGLAPQDLPGLFRRFARAEDARRGTVKGTGLGLYIARELVTAHGGEITVASVPGGKTTFRFTIPIGAPPAGRPAA